MAVGVDVIQVLPVGVAVEYQVMRLAVVEFGSQQVDDLCKALAEAGISPYFIEQGIGFQHVDVGIHGLGGNAVAVIAQLLGGSP